MQLSFAFAIANVGNTSYMTDDLQCYKLKAINGIILSKKKKSRLSVVGFVRNLLITIFLWS